MWQAVAAVSLMEFNGKQKMLQLLSENARLLAAEPLVQMQEDMDDEDYIPQ